MMILLFHTKKQFFFRKVVLILLKYRFNPAYLNGHHDTGCQTSVDNRHIVEIALEVFEIYEGRIFEEKFKLTPFRIFKNFVQNCSKRK